MVGDNIETKDVTYIDPIILEDGAKVFLTRHDPHGHIFLSLAEGEIPQKFKGAYTTIEFATTDVLKYAEERKTALKEITKKK